MERVTINGASLELTQGDITDQHVDALVNAANSRLMGGAGVDGAIHSRGGPAIMQETRRRYSDGCPTGSAIISGAGSLPAKYVIHAVGPVYSGGNQGEPALLADAHRKCLELAVAHHCCSVAFPALSTGAYGYPLDEAAPIALSTVIEFLKQHGQPEVVRFVLFHHQAMQAYSKALLALVNH